MSDVKEYRGAGLVVRFDAARCIQAGECVHGAPEVFDTKAKPWIQPEKGATERIIAVVAKCPSGALTAMREDGSATELPPATNEAHLAPDGPLFLRGDISIHDGDGKLLSPRDARRAVPLRCDEDRTVLRQQPQRHRFRARRRLRARGNERAGGRPAQDYDFQRWSGAMRWAADGVRCVRRRSVAHRPVLVLPLRCFQRQAVLRRQPQDRRFRRLSPAPAA